jgi:phosphomannomutase
MLIDVSQMFIFVNKPTLKNKTMENWKPLQNGSDIRGVAIEGVEGEDVNLTPLKVATLAKAFAIWVKKECQQQNLTIAIGRDSRISGEKLKKAFISGLQSNGVKAIDCGLCTTPAMFMTTVAALEPAHAAVMITASHLPFNRNGLKFFTHKGGLNKKDIHAILTLAEDCWDAKVVYSYKENKVIRKDFITTYAKGLVQYIRKGINHHEYYNQPLQGMHIIVDAGNGAGGFFVDKVLLPLGAKVEGSQFLAPDGYFPNHIPNPEDKTAIQSICDAVKKHKADLGIIFDTDVDRSALVDHEGSPIHRNALIALISAIVLKEHPATTIVTDSVTSDGLRQFIEQHSGYHHRFKRGYKNVINEAIRLNTIDQPCYLAIETSGHAALKENYFLDDGAFLIAKLLIEAARLHQRGKTLHHHIATLSSPKETKEIRFKIKTEDFALYGQQVLSDLIQLLTTQEGWFLIEPNYEGIRVQCQLPEEEGWFLLRMSLHDPVMPLNIESNVNGGVKKIENRLLRLLRKYKYITN